MGAYKGAFFVYMTNWNDATSSSTTWDTPADPSTSWGGVNGDQTAWITPVNPLVPHPIKTPLGLLLAITHLGYRYLPYTDTAWVDIANQQTAWR